MERAYRRTGKYLDCPICGVNFYKKRAELRPVNYCSYQCAAIGTHNLRAPSKGERRNPATEFRRGGRPINHVPVGTVRLRRHRGDGQRAWVKVKEPNVWCLRAVVLWQAMHGPVPSGYVIHHRNRDMLDDRPENLECLSRAAHLAKHRDEHQRTSKNMPTRSRDSSTFAS